MPVPTLPSVDALRAIRDHIRTNDEPNIDLLHDLANKAINSASTETTASVEALFAIRNQLEAAKSSLMFNGRWKNEAGYITDAALWIERAISAADDALPNPPEEQK